VVNPLFQRVGGLGEANLKNIFAVIRAVGRSMLQYIKNCIQERQSIAGENSELVVKTTHFHGYGIIL